MQFCSKLGSNSSITLLKYLLETNWLKHVLTVSSLLYWEDQLDFLFFMLTFYAHHAIKKFSPYLFLLGIIFLISSYLQRILTFLDGELIQSHHPPISIEEGIAI